MRGVLEAGWPSTQACARLSSLSSFYPLPLFLSSDREDVPEEGRFLPQAYSSQACTLTCRTILPSRTSRFSAPSTRVPSGYSHASLKATRSSPKTSSWTWWDISLPKTSLQYSAISCLPRSTIGELGVL